MAALSRKLRSLEWKGSKGISWWCPGCDAPHAVNVEGPGAWQWNGNADRPTLSPSVRCFTNHDANGRLPDSQTRTTCHCFVRDGMIEFCSDSPHALAGQVVPLPDWPSAGT